MSLSDISHGESCNRCNQMGDRTKMVSGKECGRARGWYCGRHAYLLGYRGKKLEQWGLSA